MSAYVNFMIKDKKTGTFMPLVSYCRSSHIYQTIKEFVPYEQAVPLTSNMIAEIIRDIEAEDSRYNEFRNDAIARKDFISKLNNSVEEKMEAYCDIEQTIAEYDELHEQLQRTISFYQFIDDMVYENGDDYVYVGHEVSAATLNGEVDD